MEPVKEPDDIQVDSPPAELQGVSQDALEPPDVEADAGQPLVDPPATGTTPPAGGSPHKPRLLMKILRRVNVYFLIFLLLLIASIAVSFISYRSSKDAAKNPVVTSQQLSQDTLKQLASSDATVGDSGQTLTIQGNAIFSGQELVRSDLNVAGSIKVGGALSVPQLTVPGNTNLMSVQVNTLQVANGGTFQGTLTVQHDLNVGGTATFGGPITAGQITVTKLILSGNAQLQVPNHIAFTGASPGRSINGGVLGAGGSASVNGSDTAGTVNVNTGGGTAAGCFVTITFTKPFAGTPHVVLTPIGAAAGQTQYYVNRSSSSFSICSDNAPPAGQAFAYDYFVTG